MRNEGESYRVVLYYMYHDDGHWTLHCTFHIGDASQYMYI